MVETTGTGTAGPARDAAPELSFVKRMSETDSRWQRHGDYAIWTGNRRLDEPGYVLHEWSEKGVVPIPHRRPSPVLHRIAGGTPYHVSHLFGFWITHDVDAVWLETVKDGASYYALMVGGTSGKPAKTDSSFVCPKCAASFGRETFDTARQGYEQFLTHARERVRAFNGDAALRTCPKCKAVHPPTYAFYAEADTADERTARLAG
nr:K791 [uncultured bacterium]